MVLIVALIMSAWGREYHSYQKEHYNRYYSTSYH